MSWQHLFQRTLLQKSIGCNNKSKTGIPKIGNIFSLSIEKILKTIFPCINEPSRIPHARESPLPLRLSPITQY